MLRCFPFCPVIIEKIMGMYCTCRWSDFATISSTPFWLLVMFLKQWMKDFLKKLRTLKNKLSLNRSFRTWWFRNMAFCHQSTQTFCCYFNTVEQFIETKIYLISDYYIKWTKFKQLLTWRRVEVIMFYWKYCNKMFVGFKNFLLSMTWYMVLIWEKELYLIFKV